MMKAIKRKISSMIKSDKINGFNFEHIKIPLIYFAMGFLWIYFSDRIADSLITDKNMLLLASTYKGWLYVIVTSGVLYILLNRFRKRVSLAEDELRYSNDEINRQYDELQYLSEHDQLTNLYNRKYYEEKLIRLDTENNLPLSVIVANINGIKLINDSFGHAAGDAMIKAVADVLTKGSRNKDVICRLAGDEFIIMSPATDTVETEKIMDHIKEIAAQGKVGQLEISVSLGYDIKTDSEENIIEIIKKAEDYMYRKKLYDSPNMRGKTINTIITTLHEKNKREEQHSRRVSQLCEQMGEALGLNEDKVNELKTVGLLHDIGKIAIDEAILNKNGTLNAEEWVEIRKHPEIGYRILSTVNNMSEMAEFVLSHHERWDGKGYPQGLSGEQIPLQSRIIGIADAYDAMISERSYKKALTKEEAIQELTANAGTQFNAECVRVFIEKVLTRED
ncbi:MAG: diguanylate cyclase [Peptostreptococcaceae bacterium]|nr:diguanylate cyclase [Peptostreptococcaceae bacterium]